VGPPPDSSGQALDACHHFSHDCDRIPETHAGIFLGYNGISSIHARRCLAVADDSPAQVRDALVRGGTPIECAHVASGRDRASIATADELRVCDHAPPRGVRGSRPVGRMTLTA
jgi:hypothetical protein